jgi:N-methylhydantoinase B
VTRSGEIVAQAADVPIHLGGMSQVVGGVVAHFGMRGLRRGDVLISNDPYLGACSHLNDITAICPVWIGRRLELFVCVTAHHADVGGRRPGSESVDSESIFQEGIRVPGLLAFRGGRLVEATVDLIKANSRTPDERVGDLRAQIGAVLRGSARLGELVDRYGAAQFVGGLDAVLNASERHFRLALRELDDGRFTACESLDPVRSSGVGVEIHVEVAKCGDSVEVDFAGTSAQVPEGRNVPYAGLVSAVLYAMKALVDPAVPANSGFYRAVAVRAPEGSLVNCEFPAGVSTRVGTAQHIAGAIFKAVSGAWGDRVVAGCDGRRKVIFSGLDSRSRKYFVYHESNAGGVGAHAHGDGISGAMAHVIQMMNLPVETLEVEYPLRVRRLELICDSGGAGRWRGGLGVRRDYEVLCDEVECTLGSERTNERMWGLAGGLPGERGRFVVDEGMTSEWEPDSSRVASVRLVAGQTLSVKTAGGGGYGDPRGREGWRVDEDRRAGLVSESGSSLYR